MARRNAFLGPQWIIVFTFFLSGIFLGGLGGYLYFAGSLSLGAKIHPAGGHSYNYINPLLAVDLYTEPGLSYNKALEQKTIGLIAAAKSAGKVTSVSVYFRDIEPGFWFGIDDYRQFSPGKSLKIPIMISYFKLAQSNPDVLKENFVFTGPVTSRPFFPVREPLVVGQEYSVDELIRRMIVDYSDDAANLLFQNIDNKSLNEVYSDLGINFQEYDQNTPDFITLKQYGLFFRILYNATYLNREYSEKALSILVQAPEDVGLSADIPKELPIANRYGVRSPNVNEYELYDCSMIYYPQHPYLLCGIFRGNNEPELNNFAKELDRKSVV